MTVIEKDASLATFLLFIFELYIKMDLKNGTRK